VRHRPRVLPVAMHSGRPALRRRGSTPRPPTVTHRTETGHPFPSPYHHLPSMSFGICHIIGLPLVIVRLCHATRPTSTWPCICMRLPIEALDQHHPSPQQPRCHRRGSCSSNAEPVADESCRGSGWGPSQSSFSHPLFVLTPSRLSQSHVHPIPTCSPTEAPGEDCTVWSSRGT